MPPHCASRHALILCLFTVAIFTAVPAAAQPPAGFTNELLKSGLSTPTAIAFLPDGRMLIVQKSGGILIADSQTAPLTTSSYMTITNIDSDDERGLLNIVLDPLFGVSNNYFYVYYHPGTPQAGRVSRFTHQENSGGLSSTGDIGSEFVLWEDTEDYTARFHYGGGLDFGPDGTIFLTVGEHSWAAAAQDLSRANGKIIRFNSDGTVPGDNFGMSDGPGGAIYDYIYSYGLRNPFRAKWDFTYGKMFIGEVGGNDNNVSTEDLHVATLSNAGTNYGWPNCEGSCDNPDFPTCDCLTHDDPLFTYPHDGSGASITGGFVYRGGSFPALYQGAFFYGDYTRQFIRYLTLDAGGNTVTGDFDFDMNPGSVIFLDQGPDGALYYTTYSGNVRRIVYDSGNLTPNITSATATPTSGPTPLEVTFNATVTDPEGDPMTYTWVFGDGDSTAGAVAGGVVPTAMHTYATNGLYNAYLVVEDASNSTLSSFITIQVGSPPSVTIDSPPDLLAFVAGDTIAYSATAMDPDGPLDPSDYAWTIRFKHNEHFHPGPVTGQPGTSGFFVIDSTGHDWHDNTGYVIEVVVTDSDGLSAADTVEVVPDKVNVTFESSPAGVSITIDGVPRVTPFVYDTLKGFLHEVGAPASHCLSGTSYGFDNWSDGGAATHTIAVPFVDTTLTASYSPDGGSCGIPVVSGLVLNLKADEGVTAGGGVVSSWSDLSASGNDFSVIQGDPTLLPAALGGHDVIDLDGVDDVLGRGAFTGLPTGSADRSVFMVVRYDSDGYGGFAWGQSLCNETFGLGVRVSTGELMVQGWCNENDFVSSEVGDGAGWMTQSVVVQANNFAHYKDGVLIDSGTHAFGTGTARVRLGAELDDNPRVKMQVAEIAVYDRALSVGEVAQVEGYLQSEYFGPQPPAIALTAPVDNDTIAGDSIVVAWMSSGDTTQANHVHVKLDDLPRVSGQPFTGTYTFTGVSPGPHVVSVELANVSHVVLSGDSAAVYTSGLSPLALDDLTVLEQGDTSVVDVLANDSDPDGTVDTTTVSVVTPPVNGTIAAIDPVTGAIEYVHNGAYADADSFTYMVSDNNGNASAPATVRVVVILTGMPPAAENVVLAATSPAIADDDTLIASWSLITPATTASLAWYRDGSPLAALHLPVEGGPSNAIIDYSGTGLATTVSGAPAFSDAAGADGFGALLLDGVSDAVIVPDAPALDADHVTLAAWIKLNAFGDDTRIISKEYGTSQPYSIYTLNMGTAGTFLAGEDHVQFRVGLEGQNRVLLESQQAVALDTWTHVAATFDGSVMRIFINGAVDTSLAAVGVLRKNNEPLYVGGSGFYPRFFDGSIDDIRVYPRALSLSQVGMLYSGEPHVSEAETEIGDHWHFAVTPFGAGVAGQTALSNTVVIGNAVPTAVDDTTSVTAGDSVDVDVLANDSDTDGTIDTASVDVVLQPSHGTVTVDPASGVMRYRHFGSVGGADSLTYTVRDNDGAVSNVAVVHITIDVVSAAGDTPALPTRLALHPNVPNPFNPTTTIRFDVPAAGAYISLVVYNVSGRPVTRLVGGFRAGGRHSVTWDGTNRNGQRVASGVYFCRLQSAAFSSTRKMVVVQ
jgi:glucose/arabinose dehydrogenase